MASTIKSDYEPVERITICLSGALIEYNNGGIGKIIYAEDTILSDTSKEILGHVFDNEDDFFLLCRDYLTAEIFLYKYEKIADDECNVD